MQRGDLPALIALLIGLIQQMLVLTERANLTQDKWSPRITCFGEAMLWWPWCVLARLHMAEMQVNASRYK